jgi:hypothetical protein
MSEEKYLEASYRFIRVWFNQKVFYDTYVKEHLTEELPIEQCLQEDKICALEYKTDLFDLVMYDAESGVTRLPEHFTTRQMKPLDEETLSWRVRNLTYNKCSSFNTKEIYIIEHLFGLNGETAALLSSGEAAQS